MNYSKALTVSVNSAHCTTLEIKAARIILKQIINDLKERRAVMKKVLKERKQK